MPVPSVDFNSLVVEEIPQVHRTPKNVAWFQGIISAMILLQSIFWKYCFGDEISNLWDGGVTYGLNDTVVTYFGTYLSVQSDNVGNDPNNSPDFWYKISDSYIGANERSLYCSQKLSMEYGLNRYFRTLFRQPTTIISGGYDPKSDIYIETVQVVYASFVSYTQDSLSSDSFTNNSGNVASFTTVILSDDTTYKYIVYIPTSLSVLLGLNYDSIIRSKVDLMGLLGTSYSVVLY